MVQREIEKQGISTISISLSKEITKPLNLPRSVFTNLPLGHPFSFPGQRFRQINILRLLLHYLKEIEQPGTMVELDLTESDDPSVVCDTCGIV